MRKSSTFVAIGFAAACFGTAAVAQDAGLSISPNLESLAVSQAPAEFRVSRDVAPSPLDAAPTAAPGFLASPNDAMTAPAAPGSGMGIEIPTTGDAALAVQTPTGAQQTAQGFASASVGLSTSHGVSPMLGFDTSTSLTTSFAPQAPTATGVTLGR